MYSPRIREDLIPRVYRIAKATGVRMTTWINQAIERRLSEETEPPEEGKPDRTLMRKRKRFLQQGGQQP